MEAARRQQEHQQALEDNKLKQQIFKHQIDRLKIEDQMRSRELARQNFEWMQGQPEATLPHQQNLPSRSFAGGMTGLPDVVSGMVRDRMGIDAAPEPQQVPSLGTMPAPAAQDTTLGTNRLPVQIPGVGDVLGVSLMPASLEDMLASSIAAELNKVHTVNPEDRLVTGAGKVIAEGTKRPLTVPRGADVYPEGFGGPKISGQPVDATDAWPKVVSGRLVRKDGTVLATFPPLPRPGGPASTAYSRSEAAAKATAVRWKAQQLAKVEEEYQKSQPRADGTLRVDAQYNPITPMTADERTRARDQIEQFYREQIGAPDPSTPPAGLVEQGEPGQRYTYPDGSVWDLLPDGTPKKVK